MENYKSTFRGRLYLELDPTSNTGMPLTTTNKLIIFLILAAVVVAILETEPSVANQSPQLFSLLEILFFVVFSVEYMARVYGAAERPEYADRFGRIRYIFSVWALIDLAAIVPFLLTGGVYNAYVLRLLRIFRLARIAKIGRYSSALGALIEAVHSRKYELFVAFFIAAFVMIFSSSLLYIFEGQAQPESFGSIPRSLWWSVATLTTVGYGDVTPLTVMGKICAGITAITGIGMIAMPTGILASAFSEALQSQKLSKEAQTGDT